MKKLLLLLVPLAAAAVLVAVFRHAVAHVLGLDTQQSPFYNFHSGPGPEFIAMGGYTGMVLTLVHSVNCHQRGCWRVGRHKVDGTPWCGRHQYLARPGRSDNELLEQILAELRAAREGR